MFVSLLGRFLRIYRSHPKAPVQWNFHPYLLQLEDRIVPATTWTGAGYGNEWNNAANWSGDQTPGASDDVIIPTGSSVNFSAGGVSVHSLSIAGSLTINNGSLSVAGTSTIDTLTLNGGTLTGAGDLTVTNAMNWNGGTLSGTGQFALDSNAVLDLAGGDVTLDGRTLNNAGLTIVEGTGNVLLANDAVWYNLGSGELDLRNDGSFLTATSSDAGTFVNDGLFLKLADTGSSACGPGVDFENSGAVQVESGTLLLQGGGTTDGTIATDAGTTLAFDSDYTLTSTADISGAGAVNLTSGTLSLDGGSLGAANVAVGANAALTGTGTIAGNFNDAGSVTVSGLLTVTGNYTQSSSGSLGITVDNANAAGYLAVEGNVNLDGDLQISAATDFAPVQNSDYTVIQNDGSSPVNGTFATLENSTGLSLTYTGDTSGQDASIIDPVTTTVDLSSSLDAATIGQSVTFTANVTPAIASTPTGTVTFLEGTTSLGAATLSNGSATFTTDALAVGDLDISAVYSGADNFVGSTSGVLTQTVNLPAAPAIAVALAMNGQKSVTLSGSVSALDPAGLTVTFTGAVNAATVTDADGNYSLTVDADTLGDVQATTVDAFEQTSNTATASVAVAAPVLSNFTGSYAAGVVTITGKITHPDAAGMAVTIQGEPESLENGVTATADANGDFSYSFDATASDQGSVSASSVDVWGQQSNVPSFTLSLPAAPTVTLSLTMNGQKSVTLSGTVTAATAAGMTVIFAGAVNSTTVTGANGDYSLTIDADHLGDVQATTVDELGRNSNTATASVAVAAPVISNFTGSYAAGVVTITGAITHPDAAGMVVTLGGQPTSLGYGVTATAGNDGTFTYRFNATANDYGWVSASCVDAWDQQSNEPTFTLTLPAVPAVTASVNMMNGHKSITLSGTVTGDAAAGSTVTFTGAVTSTTVADACGNYFFTVDADHLGDVNATTMDELGRTSNTATATVSVAAPIISNLTAVYSDGVATISGTVAHPDANGMAVTIQGDPASLANGVTATANYNGNFTYSFEATAGDSGSVSASCVDVWGQQSNVPVCTLSLPAAPTITENVTMNGLKSVTLSGTVSGAEPAGRTVTFTGVVNTSTVTDANGNYSLTVNAEQLGDVHATTVDEFGQTSNTATATVAAAAPVISNFSYIKQSGVVTLTGTVAHPDAAGMMVTLPSALPSLINGVSVAANSSGNFSYSFQAAEGDTGSVGASCVDVWGQQSNVPTTYIV